MCVFFFFFKKKQIDNGVDRQPCTRVSSFGSLAHFRSSEHPSEARGATRCLDCPIATKCAYSAKRIYLDLVAQGHVTWPGNNIILIFIDYFFKYNIVCGKIDFIEYSECHR